MLVQLISAGEIITGLFYCGTAFFMCLLALKAEDRQRCIFRGTIALLFLVGGLEELGDAIFEEGASTIAVYAQTVLTALQVITGGLCVWAMSKVKL